MARTKSKQQPRQATMFEAGEDTPLLSGTPQAAEEAPFTPEVKTHRQTALLGTEADWATLGDAQRARRQRGRRRTWGDA